MRNFPFVSVLIVNYNGRHLLEECLSSVLNISYPKKSYEVIVVDNNSSDDSVPFIQKNYPSVQVVKSEENLGFTGGNNLGIEKAKGEYIVLLNSDVRVDKNWLTALVDCASDPKVGIVSSKLRYALPYIELTIDCPAVPRSKVFVTTDHSPIGPLLEDIICEPESLSWAVNYKSGFYDRKLGEICTRRTSGKSVVMLPIDTRKPVNTYALTLHGLESSESRPTPVEFVLGGKVIKKINLRPYEATQVILKISEKNVRKDLHWLIQNAGNIILSNGYGKDRGSVLIARDNEKREFYEEESLYYDKPVELLAACGASCLVKRSVFDHVGVLDGYYFMYYEDVEFSLRAWRAGWKIMYEPRSLGYHRHRATTGSEESAFFLSQVERNHMAFVISHFPIMTAIKEFILFKQRLVMSAVKYYVFQFVDYEYRAQIWRRKYEGRRAAFRFLRLSFARLVRSRMRFDKYWPIDRKLMQKMMY